MSTLSFRKVALWLGLVVAALYAPALDNTFHFDDSHSVEGNLAIRSMANIPTFWTDPKTSSAIPENRVYRPLVYTFYSVCWFVGGGKTWPFHVMKILMHTLVALAVFAIWRKLWQRPGWFPARSVRLKFPWVSREFSINPEWAAFFLALLFAVHPACSECAAYISATTSLQAALFYVWAFYAYLLFRESGERRHLIGSLVLYFLSVASKEEGITLPAIVFVTELFLGQGAAIERIRTGVRRSIPYFALGLVLAAWIVGMRPPEGHESRGYVSSPIYFMTQWRAYLWYMRLWFWPWDLNADSATVVYSASLTDPLVIQAVIGNVALIVFSWFNRKRWPAMLFGLVWFYITISPASSVVVLAEAINEHRMYLSYVLFVGGTFTILLACAEHLFAAEGRSRKLGWIYALVLVGLAAGARERVRVWDNDENLWVDTVEKNPTSGRALNNLALVFMSRAQYDKALQLLNDCEKYWSSYMHCSLNKGIIYAAQGDQARDRGDTQEMKRLYDQAEVSYLRAQGLSPRSSTLNHSVGRFYGDTKKDYGKAIEYLKLAIELTGGRLPEAEIQLAAFYAKLKQFDEARAALARASGVRGFEQSSLFEMGRIELDMGSPERSVQAYRKLLEINPKHVQGWYNYGVAEVALKDFASAKAAFEKTIQLDPQSEQGWFNLAYAAEKTGDGPLAVRAARELVRIAPSNGEFQDRLRELEAKFGHGST